MAKTLAQVLLASRLRAGLSQADLAGRAGIAPNNLSRLERGEKQYPRFDTVARLSRELGVSLDYVAAECGLTVARPSAGDDLRVALRLVEECLDRAQQDQADLERVADDLRGMLGQRRRTRRLR